MRFLSLWLVMGWIASQALAAEKVESHKLNVLTSVFSVDAPSASERDYRVLSTVDGRIYKVSPDNEGALGALKTAAASGAPVELKLIPGNNDFVESVELVSASRADAFAMMKWQADRKNEMVREASNRENRLAAYQPTVLENKAAATALFESVFSYNSGFDVDDHCYDRAHYWARSFYLTDKVKSMKVFIFFTPKYQREHNYKWWFHVAPFVYAGASEREYVIDPTFEEEVLTVKQWSLDFATKAKSCANGKVMGDYYAKGETEDCILVRASMYHYSPSDLNNNPSVNEWRCSDLRAVTTGIPAPNNKSSWDEVKGFLPANCR